MVAEEPLNQADAFIEPAPLEAVTPAPRVRLQLAKLAPCSVALLEAWSPGSLLSSQATAWLNAWVAERTKIMCKRKFFIVLGFKNKKVASVA